MASPGVAPTAENRPEKAGIQREVIVQEDLFGCLSHVTTVCASLQLIPCVPYFCPVSTLLFLSEKRGPFTKFLPSFYQVFYQLLPSFLEPLPHHTPPMVLIKDSHMLPFTYSINLSRKTFQICSICQGLITVSWVGGNDQTEVKRKYFLQLRRVKIGVVTQN